VFTFAGVLLLFVDLANLFAPGWAEANGLSGLGWRSGEDGQGPPLPQLASMAVSIFCIALSLDFVVLPTMALGFSGWRRLEFDFAAGGVNLSVGGLFRFRQRRFPMSAVKATIIRDLDGSDHLSVVALQTPDPSSVELWDAGLFKDGTITPAQERDLAGFFRALSVPEGQTAHSPGSATPSS
jgi:hypothetical protein